MSKYKITLELDRPDNIPEKDFIEWLKCELTFSGMHHENPLHNDKIAEHSDPESVVIVKVGGNIRIGKQIQISDEDYDALMKFSKELQIQENHSQAFPYFWEPASEKLVIDLNNEGEVKEIYDGIDCETIDAEGYADNNPDLYREFLDAEGYDIEDHPDYKYSEDLEHEWHKYIDNHPNDSRTYSSNWEQSSDHNPSLFLSDVKGHIECNKHHLGRNPRTYARSVYRMPKMESLIKIIYRLNPQPEEQINNEARRFVVKK